MSRVATRSDIEAFALEARRFRDWALKPEGGPTGVQEALRRLVVLYASALALPSQSEEPLANTDFDYDGRDEWDAVRIACAALPFQYYSSMFNPLPVPAEEPVVGDLADDVADVFHDVSEGLWLFDNGHLPDAVFQWKHSFQTHWGRHATSAISALHAYVTENDIEF
jgi:hypothetical protein